MVVSGLALIGASRAAGVRCSDVFGFKVSYEGLRILGLKLLGATTQLVARDLVDVHRTFLEYCIFSVL